jgi:hypothetical protein
MVKVSFQDLKEGTRLKEFISKKKERKEGF